MINRFEKEVKGALSTLLVLKVIKMEKRTYGYRIKKNISEITNSEIQMTDSSLYTILKTLERRYKLIKSMKNEFRVYYSLTTIGQETLTRLMDYWNFLFELSHKTFLKIDGQATKSVRVEI